MSPYPSGITGAAHSRNLGFGSYLDDMVRWYKCNDGQATHPAVAESVGAVNGTIVSATAGEAWPSGTDYLRLDGLNDYVYATSLAQYNDLAVVLRMRTQGGGGATIRGFVSQTSATANQNQWSLWQRSSNSWRLQARIYKTGGIAFTDIVSPTETLPANGTWFTAIMVYHYVGDGSSQVRLWVQADGASTITLHATSDAVVGPINSTATYRAEIGRMLGSNADCCKMDVQGGAGKGMRIFVPSAPYQAGFLDGTYAQAEATLLAA